jgi:hypothetical protein
MVKKTNRKQRKNNLAQQPSQLHKLQEKVFAPKRVIASSITNSKPKSKTQELRMSPCAIRYAAAIADPFNPIAKMACVPRSPSIPSLKNTSISRITAYVGTQGFGFCLLTPTLANDQPSIWYTTAAFTGTSVTPLSANNTLTTGVSTSTVNLPYNTAGLSSVNGAYAVFGRIVSSGLRIRYTGTTMNESGAYYCYVSPTHDNVAVTASNVNSIGNLLEATVSTIDREPCSIAAYGINDNETTYGNSNSAITNNIVFPYASVNTAFNGGFTYAVNGVTSGSPIGVIIFTGVAGSSFVVEGIQHSEYAGPSAATLATPSDADTVGFDMVQAAAAILPLKKQEPQNMHSPPLQLLLDGLKEVASALKPVALSSLSKLAAGMLM